MTWARVYRGEVIEIFEQIPARLEINGFTFDQKVFRNELKRAELGLFEVVYPSKPNAQRFNITATNIVFNENTGQVEASYETVERSIEGARASLLEKIKPLYDSKLKEGFVYMGNKYDIDDRAILFIDIESRAAQDDNVVWPNPYYWRDYDNDLVSMGKQEMVAFAYAARDFRLALQSAKWQHEAQISKLITHDAIEAYDLSTLWQ